MQLRLALAVTFGTVSLCGCGQTCSFEPIASSDTASGLQASFIRKNCGATTDFVYELRIGEKSVPASKRHVALRFDSGHQVNWPEDEKDLLNLRWANHDQLNVNIRWPVRVFKKVDHVDHVKITYD